MIWDAATGCNASCLPSAQNVITCDHMTTGGDGGAMAVVTLRTGGSIVGWWLSENHLYGK